MISLMWQKEKSSITKILSNGLLHALVATPAGRDHELAVAHAQQMVFAHHPRHPFMAGSDTTPRVMIRSNLQFLQFLALRHPHYAVGRTVIIDFGFDFRSALGPQITVLERWNG